MSTGIIGREASHSNVHSLRRPKNVALPQSEFGGLLRQLRVGVGISQRKLAERADIDHSYVSRLEAGLRAPAREAVSRLSDGLNLESHQRDALLASAGFLPKDINSLQGGEPVILQLFDILQDETIPQSYRMAIRKQLESIYDLASLLLNRVIPILPNRDALTT